MEGNLRAGENPSPSKGSRHPGSLRGMFVQNFGAGGGCCNVATRRTLECLSFQLRFLGFASRPLGWFAFFTL